MERLRNRLAVAAALALALACATAGCEDGSSDSPDARVSGTWSFFANASTPPRTVACTGEHSPLVDGLTLCDAFVITIQQDSLAFSGINGTGCGLTWSFAGSVSGSAVTGVLTSVTGDPADPEDRISVSGTVREGFSVMALNAGSFVRQGLSGGCTLAGIYDGTRTALPPTVPVP